MLLWDESMSYSTWNHSGEITHFAKGIQGTLYRGRDIWILENEQYLFRKIPLTSAFYNTRQPGQALIQSAHTAGVYSGC